VSSYPFTGRAIVWPSPLRVGSLTLGGHERRPGGEAVLERMSEMLFVDVPRRYVDALPAGQTGWLAGMRDPSIGRVLALLHEKPEAPWTLERLAEDAAMSRSTLHEHFVHFIGQPPMQYLAQWRMQVAVRLLGDTKAKLPRWPSAWGTRARLRSPARSSPDVLGMAGQERPPGGRWDAVVGPAHVLGDGPGRHRES
jgi:AraC-like DNA-binding protein